MGFCVLHDTCGRYLALREGFTCSLNVLLCRSVAEASKKAERASWQSEEDSEQQEASTTQERQDQW